MEFELRIMIPTVNISN